MIFLMENEGRTAARGQIEINHKPEDVLRMILNPAYRKTYDVMFEEGGMQKAVGPNTYIMYNKMKKVSVVASRDVCIILHVEKNKDGSYKTFSYSVEDDDIPEKKGCVRAYLNVSAFNFNFAKRLVDG